MAITQRPFFDDRWPVSPRQEVTENLLAKMERLALDCKMQLANDSPIIQGNYAEHVPLLIREIRRLQGIYRQDVYDRKG